MRIQLDPRNAEKLRGHPATRRDHVRHDQVRCHLTQDRHIDHCHSRGTLVDFAPSSVSSSNFGGSRPPSSTTSIPASLSGTHPSSTRQQDGESPAADSRDTAPAQECVSRFGTGDHRDSHGPPFAQADAPEVWRLRRGMNETSNVSSDLDNAHTVEVFLSALQAEDLDTASAVLDENLVYENVGFPTIRGRACTVKLFRSLLGQGQVRSEDSSHRRQRRVCAHRTHR